jgi:23S rRNA-/tRNA-specific pseudouridylate synthase
MMHSTSISSRLPKPSILYSSNHLLVVNKPPGYHSIPNKTTAETKSANANNSNNNDTCTISTSSKDTDITDKCLLSYLKSQGLGGGSTNDFLLPLHRLDQPCSGILLLGKTRRIASRIQNHWTAVKKQYVCVLDNSIQYHGAGGMARGLVEASTVSLSQGSTTEKNEWNELQGQALPATSRASTVLGARHSTIKHVGGLSVSMVPISSKQLTDEQRQNLRVSSLRWKQLDERILLVETNQGTRHMIRALLAMANCPLAGDLRYGAVRPLNDRSVALHARHLYLPDTLQLGNQANTQRSFCAPIPHTWNEYFGLVESDIVKLEKNCK